MNSNFVLELLKKNINDNFQITETRFSELFGHMKKEDQYLICQLMIQNNIEMVGDDELLASLDTEDSEPCEASISTLKALNEEIQDSSAKQDYKPLLNLSNEQLALLAQDNNLQAMAALIEKNKRFVYQKANEQAFKFAKTDFEIDDFIQEANIGFIEGTLRFRSEYNTKLLTYVEYWMRQRMTRAAVDNGYEIRLPVHLHDTLCKLFSIRKQYPDADVPTIAKTMCISEQKVEYLLILSEQYINTTSLNTLIGEDSETELNEMIPDESESVEEIFEKKQLKESLLNILNTLSPREAAVLKSRFGLDSGIGKTLEEVGREFNVTRERIRQIEAKALRKLSHPSRSKKIRDFMY